MSNNNDKKIYHNTTNLVDEELATATGKAVFLKDRVMDVFREFPEDKTPFEVTVKLLQRGYRHPVWSVRARMTDLRKHGDLIMSEKADRKGDFNANNHTWRLAMAADKKDNHE